jgi:hypothetical protein
MGEWMYRSTFSWPRQQLEVSSQLQGPAALPPRKEPPVPTGYEVGWTPEPVWTTWGENSWAYRDSNSDPSYSAGSQWLYRMRYPSSQMKEYSESMCKICRSQWQHCLRHEQFSPARNTGVVGSNPARGMYVCVRLFCVCIVLCIGRGLPMGWSPVQGVLPNVYRIKKLKSGQGLTKGCRAIDRQACQVYVLAYGLKQMYRHCMNGVLIFLQFWNMSFVLPTYLQKQTNPVDIKYAGFTDSSIVSTQDIQYICIRNFYRLSCINYMRNGVCIRGSWADAYFSLKLQIKTRKHLNYKHTREMSCLPDVSFKWLKLRGKPTIFES